MDLFSDTLYARKETKGRHFNQVGEAMSRVTASVMFFLGREDCASEPSHAIRTLLSNSLLTVFKNGENIDLIHKWRSIYNSFVEVQISLPSLDTIQ